MKKKSSALVLIFVVLFVSVQTLNLNRVIKSSGLSLNYLNLNGAWNLINSNQSISVTGTVPGNVYSDLRANKIIGDPYYRFNDVVYRWVALDTWTYSTSFNIVDSIFSQKSIFLVCEGLDTIATITINGKQITTTDNQFREYIIDVKSVLVKGTNQISITFDSASVWATKKAKSYPYVVPFSQSSVQNGLPNPNFIRKEQCSFSWDWGPGFTPAGIWRPIWIVAFSSAVITETVPQIFKEKDNFRVEIETRLIASETTSGTLVASVLKASTKSSVNLAPGENRVRMTLHVPLDIVNLWWPNGYGDQPLYQLNVSFTSTSGEFDLLSKKVGFRDLQIITEPVKDDTGLSFYVRVNGVNIFAKGSNWIPADSFEDRVTKNVLEFLLQSAADTNMNMIRVWGGGIYQSEEFYDICDRLGLMIWQDMMFACAMYPRDNEFLTTVRAEIDYQVARLSHHPSIAVWSGNNENEGALHWYQEINENPFLYVEDYCVLYTDTVRDQIIKIDTSRPFTESSPSNGALSQDPYVQRWGNCQDAHYGDVHYYNYDAFCTDVTKFPDTRFMSEFGFQSFPSLYTLSPVLLPSDLTYNSSAMNHRQHHDGGTDQLVNQLKMHFKMPNSSNSTKLFDDFIYLTQTVQTMCIKAESEHFRRLKAQRQMTMGLMFWQLNDIWQAPTWASIEYGGRWKMLQYAARNFYADILVSAVENPVDSLSVHVTSDLLKLVSGSVHFTLWNWNGNKISEWDQSFVVSSQWSVQIYSTSINQLIKGKCSRQECLLTFEYSDQLSFFFLANLTSVNLPTPNISTQNFAQLHPSIVTFQVTSDHLSPWTWFETPLQGVFNDNGVLLLPKVTKTLTFTSLSPVTTSQLQSSLRIRTIRSTYT